MTPSTTDQKSLSLEQRLLARYGELIEAAELAKLLRYSNVLTLKRAIASKQVNLKLAKLGKRSMVSTCDVARYLVSSGISEWPGQ